MAFPGTANGAAWTTGKISTKHVRHCSVYDRSASLPYRISVKCVFVWSLHKMFRVFQLFAAELFGRYVRGGSACRF